MFKDSFGRIHDYLKIPLTDNCNFRCAYCMPQEEMERKPPSKLISEEEIVENAGLCPTRIRCCQVKRKTLIPFYDA